jgi:hypothetical protein
MRDGRYARIVCWKCPEVTPMREVMDRIIDRWPNPGDLLHAALEGLVVAEISDATWPRMEPVPLFDPRRGQGLQSFRASRVAVSARFRPAR